MNRADKKIELMFYQPEDDPNMVYIKIIHQGAEPFVPVTRTDIEKLIGYLKPDHHACITFDVDDPAVVKANKNQSN